MTCHLGDFARVLRASGASSPTSSARAPASSRPRSSEREKRQQQLAALRKRMKDHPCHRCTEREQHARWAERWWKLKRETDKLRSQIQSRTGAVAKVFDRVTDVLLELGYLAGRGRRDGADGPRAHPQAHLRRARPAGRRVPAPQRLEGPRRARARRHGVRARLRAASRRRARQRAHPAARSVPPGARADAPSSGASSTTSSRSTACPAASLRRRRSRWRCTMWSRGSRPRRRAVGGRHGGRRLRPLDQADDRPARPAVARGAGERRAASRGRRSTPSAAASSRTRRSPEPVA